MQESKVFFTNLRARTDMNLLTKLERLLRRAGMDEMEFADKFTAIKIHFGEPGNLAYLRPNYARVLVDMIHEKGGKVFLTDCNTLYVGGRKNALDHMDAAYQNGYNPFATDCHVIIADGLKGTDEVLVPVEGGQYVKEAKIGRAIMDADIFITLSHFKGHESTGFGGTLKNIGMGCGSRAGKMEMHSAGKPFVDADSCIGCGMCKRICAHDAITIAGKKASIDHSRCVGCGRCIGVCPKDAVCAAGDEANDILNCKIAEYSKAVLEGRKSFHVSLVIDISPNCDCHAENDLAIVPDVGMFCSFDPVALDKACADAVNRMPIMPGSALDDNNQEMKRDHDHGHSKDHFYINHPETNWLSCLEHAQKLGLGTMNYKLYEV